MTEEKDLNTLGDDDIGADPIDIDLGDKLKEKEEGLESDEDLNEDDF